MQHQQQVEGGSVANAAESDIWHGRFEEFENNLRTNFQINDTQLEVLSNRNVYEKISRQLYQHANEKLQSGGVTAQQMAKADYIKQINDIHSQITGKDNDLPATEVIRIGELRAHLVNVISKLLTVMVSLKFVDDNERAKFRNVIKSNLGHPTFSFLMDSSKMNYRDVTSVLLRCLQTLNALRQEFEMKDEVKLKTSKLYRISDENVRKVLSERVKEGGLLSGMDLSETIAPLLSIPWESVASTPEEAQLIIMNSQSLYAVNGITKQKLIARQPGSMFKTKSITAFDSQLQVMDADAIHAQGISSATDVDRAENELWRETISTFDGTGLKRLQENRLLCMCMINECYNSLPFKAAIEPSYVKLLDSWSLIFDEINIDTVKKITAAVDFLMCFTDDSQKGDAHKWLRKNPNQVLLTQLMADTEWFKYNWKSPKDIPTSDLRLAVISTVDPVTMAGYIKNNLLEISNGLIPKELQEVLITILQTSAKKDCYATTFQNLRLARSLIQANKERYEILLQLSRLVKSILKWETAEKIYPADIARLIPILSMDKNNVGSLIREQSVDTIGSGDGLSVHSTGVQASGGALTRSMMSTINVELERWNRSFGIILSNFDKLFDVDSDPSESTDFSYKQICNFYLNIEEWYNEQ